MMKQHVSGGAIRAIISFICEKHQINKYNLTDKELTAQALNILEQNFKEADLDQQVKEYETIIRKKIPDAVHIMGEMTFTFRLVSRLKDIGIPCIASTTECVVRIDTNGKKISSFNFVRFRNY